MTRAEWKNAPDFAEVAEVLNVKTTQILAAKVDENIVDSQQIDVLYTLEPNTERVFAVRLRRDNDGILRYNGLPAELPGFLEQMRENIRRNLDDS